MFRRNLWRCGRIISFGVYRQYRCSTRSIGNKNGFIPTGILSFLTISKSWSSDSASTLAIFVFSRDDSYVSMINDNGGFDILGNTLDKNIELLQNGDRPNRSLYYTLASLSNLARTALGKSLLCSPIWLNRIDTLISISHDIRNQFSLIDKAQLKLCLSSLCASLSSFSNSDEASLLLDFGVMKWIDLLLEDNLSALESKELLLTVKTLLEDHYQHPLSLPTSLSFEYTHKSSRSSWWHYLEGDECNDFVLLFSLITLAEISQNESNIERIMNEGGFSLLEFACERANSDEIILPVLIRTLCQLSRHDTVKYEIIKSKFWMKEIESWTCSSNPRMIFFTANLLSILMHNREVGVKVLVEIGIDKLSKLASVVDIDIRHTLEYLLNTIIIHESDNDDIDIELGMVIDDELNIKQLKE